MGGYAFSPWLFTLDDRGVEATGVSRGVPGEVGGRERGAELILCAPRLCPSDDSGREEGPDVADSERVFLNVIVTEKGSPAK